MRYYIFYFMHLWDISHHINTLRVKNRNTRYVNSSRYLRKQIFTFASLKRLPFLIKPLLLYDSCDTTDGFVLHKINYKNYKEYLKNPRERDGDNRPALIRRRWSWFTPDISVPRKKNGTDLGMYPFSLAEAFGNPYGRCGKREREREREKTRELQRGEP